MAITTRETTATGVTNKGSPLTNAEVDTNFVELKQDKLENVVEDTSPQLGGDLDLNSNDITGTGGVNITGNIALSGTVDGRDVAADGTKLDGIESGATADQTNAEIRAAVEAASDSNVFTDADHTKLNGIEASADVTDTANVTTAGALMDSEVTNLAQVKAFSASDYATAAQGTKADSALQNVVEDTTPQLGGNLDFNGNTATTFTSTGIDDNASQTSMVLSNGSMRILSDDLSSHIASIYGYDDTNSTSLGQLQFGASMGQNSGIYSSSAFSISNAAGDATYAFTVDTANSRVGIGATTVNRKLELAGNNNGGAKANYLRITDTDTSATAANQQGGIEFYASDSSGGAGVTASMEVVYAGSGGGGEITFNTAANSGAGVAEAMRIDESGNVGIGAASPSGKLHIEDSYNGIFIGDGTHPTFGSAEYIQFNRTSSAADLSAIGVENGAQGRLVLASREGIIFATGGSVGWEATSESVRIDNSGNVGIGTDSPAYALDVDSTIHIGNDGGSSFSHSRLILDSNGASRAAGIFSHNQTNDTEWFFGNPYDTPDSFAINRQATASHNDSTSNKTNSLVTVNSSGNVQISTSAGNYTDALLTVRNNTNAIDWGHTNTAGYGSTLGANSGSGAPFVGLSCGAGTNSNTFRTYGLKGSLITTDNAGSLIFSRITTASADNQSPTESMRIDSSGQVGIGTTPNSYANYRVLTLRGTSGSEIDFENSSGTVIGAIYNNATDLVIASDFTNAVASSNILFTCDGTERVRITSTGLMGINTPAPQSPIQINKTPPTAFGSPFLSIGHDAYTGSGMYTIAFGYELGSGSNAPAEIGMVSTSDSGYTKGDLVFATRNVTTDTAPTERARITGAGHLLVGCNSFGSISTEGCQLSNGGTAIFSNDSDVPLYLNRVIGGTGYTALVSIYREDAQSGFIGASQGTTPTFAAPSDIRLKNNVTDHESELTNVMALRPVRWDWKDETRGSGEGFVAQELEQTAWTDLVSEGEDGYKIVSGLGAVETRLIKAIQELSAQVTELKAEVAALKGE